MDYVSLAYHALHIILIGFILSGWLVKRWRKIHFMAILIIWVSWIGLGWYVGYIGYCPLTDWHWQHLQALAHSRGESITLPPSYIEYLLWQAGSGDLPDKAVSDGVAVVFVAITVLSTYLTFFRKHR